MRRGDTVTLHIEGLTPKGDGVASIDGRAVVVPRTVPGDVVEVYLKRRRRGQFEGVADNYLEHGIPRQDPLCIHFGVCGGCRWQDLAYPRQLELKQSMVAQSLRRRGLRPGEMRPVLPSPDAFGYRNKMEFSFGTGRDGGAELGLHVRERYNRIFDLEACHLQSELANRIVDSFRRHVTQRAIAVYDLKTHLGVARFLVIREGQGTGQIMVNLVVAEYPLQGVDEVMEAVLAEIPDITTALVTRHSGKAQVAVGQEEFVIKGAGCIAERCGALEFEISALSFFQTNTRQAERLYGLVGSLAGDLVGQRVLDIYAGTGGISLSLARRAAAVVGVEQVAESVEDARRNARRNEVANCEFVAESAETYLERQGGAPDAFEVIVVDPPRAGVHPRALTALGRTRPAVLLYVSCNAETMADDMAYLVQQGYRLDVVQPVDLFPQTAHCEAVARLRPGAI